jgi:hypothetical protein
MACNAPIETAAMPPVETTSAIAFTVPFHARPGSGWNSWAPEVADLPELAEPDAEVGRLGGMLCLLMWGCASLLAVWYL